MFELERLLGRPIKGIALQTRLGNHIPNSLGSAEWDEHLRRREEILRGRGALWVKRKSATVLYNCAGHVWASRRTHIADNDAWEMIFRDDGYRRLASKDEAWPGDLVVYRDPEGNYLHVGEVVEIRRITGDARTATPWALSKLAEHGEYLHNVYDMDPLLKVFSARIEFWSDRAPGD